MPSPSPTRVSVTPHRSNKRYQSALLRAKRETSRPSTIPARPIATSVVRCAKPERSTHPEPDRPRSSSMTITCSLAQLADFFHQIILPSGGLAVVGDLCGAGLTNIDVGCALDMVGSYFARIIHGSSPSPAR